MFQALIWQAMWNKLVQRLQGLRLVPSVRSIVASFGSIGLFVCLFVCLPVSTIIQNVVNRSRWLGDRGPGL